MLRVTKFHNQRVVASWIVSNMRLTLLHVFMFSSLFFCVSFYFVFFLIFFLLFVLFAEGKLFLKWSARNSICVFDGESSLVQIESKCIKGGHQEQRRITKRNKTKYKRRKEEKWNVLIWRYLFCCKVLFSSIFLFNFGETSQRSCH